MNLDDFGVGAFTSMVNVIRDAAQAGYNERLQNRSFEMAQANYERNIREARRYNEKFMTLAPSLQKQGYMNAGLNPNLSDGVGMSVSAGPADSNISAPDGPHYSPQTFSDYSSGVLGAMLANAQVNNLEANTAKTMKELPQVEALTEYYKSQKHLTDNQAEATAVNTRKTQEEINQILESTDLTRVQKRSLLLHIEQEVPKQLEVLDSQIKLNLKELDVKDSQIYLNNERGKSEYSRRQLNIANVHNIEQLAVKTMYEALVGELTYEQSSDLFASTVQAFLSKNEYDAKYYKKETDTTVDTDEAPTFFWLMSWYNATISSIMRPLAEILKVALK